MSRCDLVSWNLQKGTWKIREFKTAKLRFFNYVRLLSQNNVDNIASRQRAGRSGVGVPIDATHFADPSGRAVKGVGLRSLVCWDCGLESRRGQGCLSVVSVVCCQVEVTASG